MTTLSSRALLALIVFQYLSGCCCINNSYIVPDKLEVVAIIGFGKAPCCVWPNYGEALLLKPNSESEIWVRLVFHDHTLKAAPNREIHIEVVDELGPSVLPTDATVVPGLIHSSADGFNFEIVTFKGVKPGVYRIKASYADKQSSAFSYSKSIIVKS